VKLYSDIFRVSHLQLTVRKKSIEHKIMILLVYTTFVIFFDVVNI